MDQPIQHPVGTPVQYTLAWLASCDAPEIRRFANREGQISGYRAQVTRYTPEPTILFPRKGRFQEVKKFEVPWRHIELVGTNPPIDRLPLALGLFALRRSNKPLDSYGVAKVTGMSVADARRVLDHLAELGLARGHGDGGDAPLAERFQESR